MAYVAVDCFHVDFITYKKNVISGNLKSLDDNRILRF